MTASPAKVTPLSQEESRDEALLAVVRALAIRAAREDHAASEARKQRRKAKTLPAEQD